MSSAAPNRPAPRGERLRVFLSHASDDDQIVPELYDRLKADGVVPWMDTRDLIAGVDWQEETFKALESADAIIFCLSQATFGARGVVNEIRWAAESATRKSDNALLLIPARLEECPVPTALASLYYVDLSKEDGYDKLVQALNTLARKLNKVPIGPKRKELQLLSRPACKSGAGAASFVWILERWAAELIRQGSD